MRGINSTSNQGLIQTSLSCISGSTNPTIIQLTGIEPLFNPSLNLTALPPPKNHVCLFYLDLEGVSIQLEGKSDTI